MDTGKTKKPLKRKNINPVEDVQMSEQQAKEKQVTPPQRRHHGLYNQGATCGLNSVLQVPFMTTELHDRLDSRSQKDQLRKIFEGLKETTFGIKNGEQLTYTYKCSKGHINVETASFWTLPLSLKDTPDTTLEVICEMVKAPQILILLLKRFDFGSNNRSHFKSDCCVEVPRELQFKNKTYKLYRMVNHMGSITGGHYTATVLSEDNTWYECDDSHVSKIKDQLFAEDGTFRSRTVCLLMCRALHYGQYDQGDTNDRNLFSQKDTHHTTYSEERSLKCNVNTKSFTGDNKVFGDEKMKEPSSSAKETILAHKVQLINVLSADHTYILQHAHAKKIITDRQYMNIKRESSLNCVTELIDYVILVNGQKSCTDFLGVLKLPDVLDTYPQLEEIINKMLRSNSGRNA